MGGTGSLINIRGRWERLSSHTSPVPHKKPIRSPTIVSLRAFLVKIAVVFDNYHASLHEKSPIETLTFGCQFETKCSFRKQLSCEFSPKH